METQTGLSLVYEALRRVNQIRISKNASHGGIDGSGLGWRGTPPARQREDQGGEKSLKFGKNCVKIFAESPVEKSEQYVSNRRNAVIGARAEIC
jgi:hypothetical protein